MIDEESRLNLEADRVAVYEFLAQLGGELVHRADVDDGSLYWVRLRPRSAPEETYVARIGWSRYPQAAPSVKFADGVGGSLTVTRAWPVIAAYRAASFDICKPFTAEGFALHAEWRTGPQAWSMSGNPFLWVVSQLQDDLNHRYQGRSQ
ncbi:MAG: hypothetical protein QOC81_841 [Thermoanaerobaculia bacterium]|jgi:hypothetical protein|nr:hypothetical protein [Thermoanaerobaculia bacterium]